MSKSRARRSLIDDPVALQRLEVLREAFSTAREAFPGVSDVVSYPLAFEVRVTDEGEESVMRIERVSPRSPKIESLIESMLPEDPPGVPSTALVLQAQRNAAARTELLREFGYLTAEQIADLRASKAANRSALAGRWRGEGLVFSVDWRGRRLYPAFQFDGDGAPLPVIADVLRALPSDRMSEWETALWWTAANGWLEGARPVDLLDEHPGRVVAAAARLAEPSPL